MKLSQKHAKLRSNLQKNDARVKWHGEGEMGHGGGRNGTLMAGETERGKRPANSHDATLQNKNK